MYTCLFMHVYILLCAQFFKDSFAFHLFYIFNTLSICWWIHSAMYRFFPTFRANVVIWSYDFIELIDKLILNHQSINKYCTKKFIDYYTTRTLRIYHTQDNIILFYLNIFVTGVLLSVYLYSYLIHQFFTI